MTTSTRRRFLIGTAACTGLALAGSRSAAARAPLSAGAPASEPVLAPPPPWAVAGAPPDDDGAERLAFLDAVRNGRAPDVAARLEAHPELVDARDDRGRSALVLAALEQHRTVVDVLLRHEPQVDLVEAVMIPDWERAEALADAHPDRLDAWHPVGGTALYAAARAGEEGFWRLQFRGADPNGNPRGRQGVTPAYGALQCKSPIDAWRCTVALLSNAAHVNAPQRGGDSLLHVAARRGDPHIVRYLLRRGADVHATDARGETPLRHAERLGHAVVADLLRDPTVVPRDDMTLRYAYDASGAPVVWPDLSDVSWKEQGAVTGPSHFDLDAVRAAVGDDPRRSFSRSTQDELAIEACGHTGNREILRYHLDHGVPQSLATSISVGDLARARALLEENPGSVNERGPHDFPMMWYPAIGGGSVEAAQLLLDAGAEIDQESKGTTGLHWAVARGRPDLAVFLVEQGADLQAVGYNSERTGQTPLQLAKDRGKDDMVRLLGDLGATG